MSLLPGLAPSPRSCLTRLIKRALVAELAMAPPCRRYATAAAAAARNEGTATIMGSRAAYRQLRLKELEEDRKSANPLFNETYPRLKHGANPTPVPTLRKTYVDASDVDLLLDRSVTVYGRIRSMRCHSSRLIFLDIVNQFETIQIMVNFRRLSHIPSLTLEKLKLWTRLVAIGDHISITGRPDRTKTGELTVVASELPQLLAPALEQIPEQLVDDRMSRRHVDLLVNKESSDILRLKSHITKYMRDFFHNRHYTEYQTPILAERAGGAIAQPFVTHSTEMPSRELQLRVAPELWLKQLVISGVDKVFEIGPVFRNEAIDSSHNPEFTMCEFYSAYINLEDLITETEDLLCGLAARCKHLADTDLTALHPPDLGSFARPFTRLPFIPALEQALGFRLPNLSAKTALADLNAALAAAGIAVPGSPPAPTSLPKLLDRLAGAYLEPLSRNNPLFITHHPACMSPLAKSFLCPNTLQLISARTELFFNSREIANMYEEENDPAQQRIKLDAHRELAALSATLPRRPASAASAASTTRLVRPLLRRLRLRTSRNQRFLQSRQPPHDDCPPLDRNYISALNAGLPPTGGWGCGVERLVMLFSGANRLGDCLAFGTLRHVVMSNLSAEDDIPPTAAKVAAPATG